MCHCPFGNQEPYVSKKEQERFGSKESMWHEASKFDWLMSRPDIKNNPNHEMFLRTLARQYPDADELYPWLLRELKKKRLDAGLRVSGGRVKSFHDPEADFDPSIIDWENERPPASAAAFVSANSLDPYFRFQDHKSAMRPLDPEHLEQLQDWMKYQKQAKKGVDIMTHEIGPAVHMAQEADKGGQVVHTFPSGHTVVHLRNKRDMRREGQRMNHCVGSNGMGYIEKNDEGKGLYYSLRDSDNDPLGTAEVLPTAEAYYKCPSCGKFDFGTDSLQNKPDGTRLWTKACTNCAADLATTNDFYGFNGGSTPQLAEGVKSFNTKLNPKKPSSDHTHIAQMFGPSDNKMDDYHNHLFNEFFGIHGHEPYESDGDHEEEEEEEEFEPWWDNEYFVDAPNNPDEYMDQHDDLYSWAPEQWERAHSDAQEHGHESPDLYPQDPDWEDMVDHIVNNDINPEQIDRFWQVAKERNNLDELATATQNWLEEQYYPYLDPYGEYQGKGHGVGSRPGQEPAVNEPGSHYPESVPNEKYAARNFEYQLEKHLPVDPQTQHRRDEYQRNQAYPFLQPQNAQDYPGLRGWRQPHDIDPRMMKDEVPIPEQTGPALLGPGGGRGQRVELPYGRGETPPIVRPRYGPAPPELTEGVGDSVQRDMNGNPLPRPRGPADWNPSGNIPSGPTTPEEYFTPGAETTRMHQRAFPGMEFTRGDHWNFNAEPEESGTGAGDNGIRQRPYNPAEPYQFGHGQQQGSLMPTGWYVDYAKKRVIESQLPPHLFPKDRYGHHMPEGSFTGMYPSPGDQYPLWENMEAFPKALINTQQEPYDPHNDQGGALAMDYERPRGEWRANVKNHRVEQFKGNHGLKMHGFDWRVPIIYDRNEDRMYVGQPGGEHGDLAKQFDKPNPWGPNYDGKDYAQVGYIDTKPEGSTDSGPGLHWFQESDIPNEEELHDWVEANFGVRRKSQGTPDWEKYNDLAWS